MLELLTILIMDTNNPNMALCSGLYNHSTQQVMTESIHCITVVDPYQGVRYDNMDEAESMLANDDDQSIQIIVDGEIIERYKPSHVFRSLFDPCYPSYEPEC